MTATSVSSSPPTTEPLRTRPSAKVTITLLAPSITWCVVRTWPCASRRTPEPNPRRGHGRPNGGPYAAPAVLTLTVLTPTRSTALTYAFCKSAIMATSRPPRGLLSEFPRGRSQSRPATKKHVGRPWRGLLSPGAYSGALRTKTPETLPRPHSTIDLLRSG